ncbi:MAG: hypothetical protein Q4C64_02730 [Erysipelotrichia bacterium]|nr:hypothetical protein [Erysipelotrichia bacterium]
MQRFNRSVDIGLVVVFATTGIFWLKVGAVIYNILGNNNYSEFGSIFSFGMFHIIMAIYFLVKKEKKNDQKEDEKDNKREIVEGLIFFPATAIISFVLQMFLCKMKKWYLIAGLWCQRLIPASIIGAIIVYITYFIEKKRGNINF